MKKSIIALLIILVFVLGGMFVIFRPFSDGGIFAGQGEDISANVEAELPPPPPPEPIELTISCVGDVMVHKPQIPAQYMGDGVYDFTNNFEYVKPYISDADVAICNVETTFAGEPYTGYPAFCAPDALAEGLVWAGFDVALTSNNHMMDKGKSGLLRTREVLDQSGLKVSGSVLDPSAPRYAMYNAKGIDVAVIGYTYQTSAGKGRVSINGNAVSEEAAALINSFSYEYIDEELIKIKETVDAARAAGADIVVMYYHWGEEYQLSANKWQRYIAEKTVELMDVDIIFASHPHVLQEAEFIARSAPGDTGTIDGAEVTAGTEGGISGTDGGISGTEGGISGTDGGISDTDGGQVTAAVNGNADGSVQATSDVVSTNDGETGITTVATEKAPVPVFYSMGNFISNQRTETLSIANDKYTEQGVIATVDISIMEETGEIVDISMRAMPTWVDRYQAEGKNHYYIIPLDENLDANATLAASGHLSRAQGAREDANGLLKID